MQRTVDYAAFDEPVDPAALEQFKRAHGITAFSIGPGAAKVVFGVLIAFMVVVLLIAVAVPLGMGLLSGQLGGAFGIMPFFFVLPAVFAVVALVRVARRGLPKGTSSTDRFRLDRFARANGLVYARSSAAPQYPGMIFQRGERRRSEDHLRSADGRFVDFGNYRYVTKRRSNGRTRTTTHSWGFLAIHLDRALPHMVLDAKANDSLMGSSLPMTLGRDQRLSLEGDFDRHFTLYAPKEYETDALYVFTPDLMALLIDEAGAFDVEIIDRWLFVYSPTPFPMGSAAVVQRLLRIVDTVGAKAISQTDRYRDDRVGDFGANTVAPEGRRLRRGFPIAIAVFFGLGIVMTVLQVLLRG